MICAWKNVRQLVALAGVLGLACGPQPKTSRPPGDAPTGDGSSASLLCVVRHAEAYKNLDPRPPDLSAEQLDALTPAGEAQARRLRAALPAGVALVWASPTGRTRRTAELLELGPPVQVEADLRSLAGERSLAERKLDWARGEDPRPEQGESLADGAVRARALLERLRGALTPGVTCGRHPRGHRAAPARGAARHAALGAAQPRRAGDG